MIVETIIIGGAAVAGLGTVGGLIKSMLYTVKEREEALVQQFGAYVSTTQKAGLHFKLPWRRVTKVTSALSEVKENLQTKTKDDIFVTLPIKAHVQIQDSKRYAFDANNPTEQLMTRISAAVKQLVSSTDFAELYSARETISQRVNESVGKEILELYGIKLIDVIVDEPHVGGDFQERYNNVKASEMDRAAARNAAEAEKIRIIAEAEARKEALRLDGEGVAAQRKAIFDGYAEQFNALSSKGGITPEHTQQLIMVAMTNDTIRDAAKHGNVIVTNSGLSSNLGEFSAVEKLMGGANPVKGRPQGQQRPANG